MTLLIFIISTLLGLICKIASAGLVNPYGAKFITLSSTNAGDVADYNFTMSLDTDLPSPGTIEISFPVNQYVSGLGLPYSIEAYSPYPSSKTCTLDATTAKTLICEVGKRTAGEPFTIELRDIRNPLKVGGTGNFKIVSKAGTKTLDANFAFGSIGIFPSATELLSASIDFKSGSSDKAGEYSEYELTFVPGVQLPSLIDVKVEFPVIYDLSAIQSYQCSGYAGTVFLSLYCTKISSLKNVIIFSGFSSSDAISKGTEVKLYLTNVVNPPREMATEAFKYFIREVGTNNTIEKFEGVPGLTIQPGKINSVVLENRYSTYPLYTSIQREVLLSFRPSNPCNVIKIATHFPIISWCNVIQGLSQKDDVTSITCSPSSHVIIIRNFETYNPEDIYLKVVKVTFIATLPTTAIKTNMVEIYTFLDEGFEQKVDQDTSSAASQVQIVSLTTTTTHANSALTTANVNLGASNTFSFGIIPSTTQAIDSITVEFGHDFVGLAVCDWKLPGVSPWVSKTCTLSRGVLSMTISDTITTSGTIIAGTQSPCTIQISGITNPILPGTYTFRYYLVASGIVKEWGSKTFTMATTTIPTYTLKPLATRPNARMPIYFHMISPVFLPDGYFLSDEPTKLTGRIDISLRTYGGVDWFPYNLGTTYTTPTKIPCEIHGLEPSVFATAPACLLIPAPTAPAATNYVTVRIIDFNPILIGTSIDINFPTINCITASVVSEGRIRLYIEKEYTQYLVAEEIEAFTVTTSLGALTPATANSLTLANTTVQATTDLTFSFSTTGTTITATANNSIQINYPTGYTIDPTTSVVTLGGTIQAANKLHFFENYDFFTIELAADLTNAAHIVTISNIKNPLAAPASTANLRVRTILSGAYYQEAIFDLSTFSPLTPGSFLAGSVAYEIVPNTRNCLFATYKFDFTTTALAPKGTKIQITFPASYTFGTNTECDDLVGIEAAVASTGITCALIANVATISGYTDIEIETEISITIRGVHNPNLDIDTQKFIISTIDASSDIIEKYEITADSSTLVAPAYTPIDLVVYTAELIPRNNLVPSHFKMTMDPGISLPKDAEMTIVFPSAFGVLFSSTTDNVECNAFGGLTVLTECSVAATVLTLKFGTYTDPEIPIEIYFFGLISYPDPLTTLTGFTVTLSYLSTTIATAVTFPAITTADTMPAIGAISMDYYPRNEGEIANYVFTFTLNTAALTSTMYFLVRFPFEYGPRLYKYNITAESDQLIGALAVTVLHRTVLISGFSDMPVTEEISIRIWGIVNPNKVDITMTGSFGFALMDADDDDVALEGDFNIPGIVPLLAPDSIQFISLSSTMTKARYLDNFEFVFLPRQNILDTDLGGLLFMDFPPDYLIDSYGGACGIDQEFSFFVNCEIDNNRIFINSSNPEWDPDVDGQLTFTVSDIRNPDSDGDTLNFIIYNYDILSKKILGRSYSNLNPASLNYEYDGELIIVNDDLPIDLEVGTYSDEIEIKLLEGAKQTLTLTPNVLDPTILITPFPIKIDLKKTSFKFRVAAPRTILRKSFYITWSKTGDSYIPKYAPLARTEIRMRTGFITHTILFDEIDYIPRDGVSFPLNVYTNNPPYDELLINLIILYGNTHASTNTAQLKYKKGEFEQSYTITIEDTHTLPSVDIQFVIGGTDGSSYELPDDQLTIRIDPPETDLPEITSGTVLTTKRSTVEIKVEASTLSFIYYMVADRHVPVPTFEQVRGRASFDLGAWSNPIIGEDYIKTLDLAVEILIENLTPGKEYDFYAYVMNMNEVAGIAYLHKEFTTNSFNSPCLLLNFIEPQATAEFVIPIKQNTLANEQKLEIMSKIAVMMSIERARLLEKTSDCKQTLDSKKYNTPNTTYLHLYVLPDPTNEDPNNSPLSLVTELNGKREEIQTFIPRLAEGNLLGMAALEDDPDNPLELLDGPTFASATVDTLFFKVQASQCGYLHAIAIPQEGSRNFTPTETALFASDAPSLIFASSYQVYSGLNTENQPVSYSKTRVNDFSKDYELNVTGLEDKLIYDIYITLENDWPTYTNLVDNGNVAKIDLKTLKIRYPLNIKSKNYDSASYLHPCLLLLSSILIALFIL